MNFKTITLKKVNRIGVITLNRPKVLNAFNEQLIWDLQEATNNLREDDDIRVVVITGAGKGFTAGADLTQSESTWTSIKDSLNRGFLPIFKNIMEMPKPVIGSINGPAAGIGAAIAMACDLRIMSENAYILSVFSNIAIVPDGGLSWLLTRYMGYTKAFEYAIEAKKITADECINFGIANKKVLLEDLESETMAWAERLAKRAPQSLSNTKKIMRNALEKTYLETYAEEAEIQNKIFGNDQNKEAIKAFFEKNYEINKQLNKGLIEPRSGIFSFIEGVRYETLYKNFENIKIIREAIFASTNEVRGTSYASRIEDPKYQFAGKTGTSQVKRITKLDRELDLSTSEIPYNERDHALYIAFGPYKNPRYALSIVIEHGGSGSSVAAPIAKKLFKLIIDRHEIRVKKTKQNNLEI